MYHLFNYDKMGLLLSQQKVTTTKCSPAEGVHHGPNNMVVTVKKQTNSKISYRSQQCASWTFVWRL